MRSTSRILWHVLMLVTAGGSVVVADGLHRSHMGYYLAPGAAGLLCDDHGFRNCNDIAAHALSWPMGVPLTLPVILFTLALAYLAAAATIFRGLDRKAHLALGSILGLLGSLLALLLLAHSVIVVGSLCVTALLLAALCVLSWRSFSTLEREAPEPVHWSRLVPGTGAWRGTRAKSYRDFLKVGMLAILAMVTWSEFRRAREPIHQLHRFEDSVLGTLIRSLESSAAPIHVPPSGGKAIGPDGAAVTIVLVGDYQDPITRAAAQDIDRVRALWPDQLRVGFVHLPLDPTCNPAASERMNDLACRLARAAECAAGQGRFADFHHHLVTRVARGDIDGALAALESLGIDRARFDACLEAPESLQSVIDDARRCQDAGLEVVPSVVINGAVRPGAIPPRALRAVLRYLFEGPRSSNSLTTDSSAAGSMVPSRR